MADVEAANLTEIPSLDHYIKQIFERLNGLQTMQEYKSSANMPMRTEIRSLEFWKSVVCECFASFIYVFVVCGAASGPGVSGTISSVILATSLASGFTMSMLTQCLGRISGKLLFML